MVMLKSSPKLGYCGLTIVMSNQSRFDTTCGELCSGNAGYFLNELCLRPDINRYQTEIRLAEDRSPLLPNTKAVLLLGERSMKDWLGPENAKDNHLGELRGSPFVINGVPHIASYLPQDCCDLKNFERDHNPLAADYVDDETEIEDDDKDAQEEKRRHGFTKRKNYGFWLRNDLRKCKHILQYGLPTHEEPEYVIYPSLKDACHALESTKNTFFYFDIETDTNLNIICFSFSFGTKVIYVVPTLLPDYTYAYDALHQIYKSLAIAIRDNCAVAHNGSNFDFFVLAYKYRIPIGRRVWDTLIAQHRIQPEIEKSLGHCISFWTWLRFHKDLGDVPYSNQHKEQVWKYCGLDVYSMALIREAQEKYANKHPGVMESIQQGNEAVRPYLITSLMGIAYDEKQIQETISYNDRLMNHYIKWLDILIGAENLKAIRGKGKSTLLSSNTQACRYFHDILGYSVVAKGQERKDGSRGPSLGKKAMYKLRLKYNNPVIDIALAYREVAKETSTLKFTPFKL